MKIFFILLLFLINSIVYAQSDQTQNQSQTQSESKSQKGTEEKYTVGGKKLPYENFRSNAFRIINASTSFMLKPGSIFNAPVVWRGIYLDVALEYERRFSLEHGFGVRAGYFGYVILPSNEVTFQKLSAMISDPKKLLSIQQGGKFGLFYKLYIGGEYFQFTLSPWGEIGYSSFGISYGAGLNPGFNLDLGFYNMYVELECSYRNLPISSSSREGMVSIGAKISLVGFRFQ